MLVKTVEVSDAVYAELEKRVQGFGDTPNAVMARILGVSEHKEDPGPRTREAEFQIPLLQALVSLGGEGKPLNVLAKVEELMGDRLTDADQLLNRHGHPVWHPRVRWLRSHLADRGLIDRSQSGIWKITAAGRKYLRENR